MTEGWTHRNVEDQDKDIVCGEINQKKIWRGKNNDLNLIRQTLYTTPGMGLF